MIRIFVFWLRMAILWLYHTTYKCDNYICITSSFEETYFACRSIIYRTIDTISATYDNQVLWEDHRLWFHSTYCAIISVFFYKFVLIVYDRNMYCNKMSDIVILANPILTYTHLSIYQCKECDFMCLYFSVF